MTVIISGAFPKALWPGVNKWWGAAYAKHDTEWSDLFETQNSSRSYEEDVQQTGFGLAPVKPEGSAILYDTESQGVVERYTHTAYSLGFGVTREEVDDNLYMQLAQRRTEGLAFSMHQTKENVAANVYNRGFNSSYVFGDGVELFSTAHPVTGGGTQSNELSTAADLSEKSIEDMIIQIMQAQNDRGLKISIMPRSLHVHPSEYFNACRILKSTLQNDTANNAINAINAMGAVPEGVKVNHYFTDSDAWFMRTNAPQGMIHFDRTSIEFAQDTDFSTSNLLYKAYERYSFGNTDWRGVYGTPGA